MLNLSRKYREENSSKLSSSLPSLQCTRIAAMLPQAPWCCVLSVPNAPPCPLSLYWWHNLHRSWGERLTRRWQLLKWGKSISIIQKYRIAGTQTSCSRSQGSRRGNPLRETYAWDRSQYPLHVTRIIKEVWNEEVRWRIECSSAGFQL